MSLPEHRQAVAGRTHSMRWEPRAVEHCRPTRVTLRNVLLRAAVLLSLLVLIGAMCAGKSPL